MPRWSTRMMSRSRRTRSKAPADEVYRSTAEVPGPPAIRNSGSGFLLRLMAGTRATNSSIVRPSGSSGFSATRSSPHSAVSASMRAGCSSRHGLSVSCEAERWPRPRRGEAEKSCQGAKSHHAARRIHESRAAPGIQSRLRRVREMKRARISRYVPFSSGGSAISCGPGRRASGDRCGATAGSLRAAGGRVRARSPRHRPWRGASTRFRCTWPAGEAARLAHASARRSARRSGCARAGCAGAAS